MSNNTNNNNTNQTTGDNNDNGLVVGKSNSNNNSNSSSNLMYLPPDTWSARYDSTFYTVKIIGYEKLFTEPAIAATRIESTTTSSNNNNMHGNTTFPAYYYKIQILQERNEKIILRRYSQFYWLYQQLKKVKLSSQEEQHSIKFPPGTPCPFIQKQNDTFALNRQQQLSEYIHITLDIPSYANHPAVRTFLEL